MTDAILLALVVLVTVHCLPSFVAFGREHPQRWAILVLNLLFGWTFLGWGAALVWACTAVPHRPTPASASGPRHAGGLRTTPPGGDWGVDLSDGRR